MRGDFGSSRLVRLLGEWTPVDAQASGMDFAERLGLWLDAFDALALQGAHQAVRGIRAAAPGAKARAIAEDVQRVRAALAASISNGPLDAAAEAGYTPYRRRHTELQHRMEQMISPLRDHVRQALSRLSPRLRQLATLDAAVEQMLAPREQLLLPRVTSLLERRFEQRRAAGEPEAFAADWRQALLAEVDLRLEPVVGMIEALGQELKHQP